MWTSNAKDEFNVNMFTEWQPGRVQQIYLPRPLNPKASESHYRAFPVEKKKEDVPYSTYRED